MREVVAGAIVDEGRLLLAQRRTPPDLAGLWELPGGKVDAGETPAVALRRELHEELDVLVTVGPRIGMDVPLSNGLVLRAYRAVVESGSPRPLEHSAIRWVDADELRTVDLVANDRVWLDDLAAMLRAPSSTPSVDPYPWHPPFRPSSSA